jgi:DNA-binding MarR family transcriptional regulator
MTIPLPLSALLAQALAAFTMDFEREVAAAGYPDLSLALGSNVLRLLDEHGMRIGSIAERAGVTKQAISQQVAYLERHGYVSVEPDPEDSRAKVVRLTNRGRDSQDACRPLFGVLERRWRARYGSGHVVALRDSLDAIVGQVDMELAHYQPR